MSDDQLRPVAVTARWDPSDNLRAYSEGFDVTNPHYWYSLSFLAVWPVIVSVIWIALGALHGIVMYYGHLKHHTNLQENLPVLHPEIPPLEGRRKNCTSRCLPIFKLIFCFSFSTFLVATSIFVIVWSTIVARHSNSSVDVVLNVTYSAANNATNVATLLDSSSSTLSTFNETTPSSTANPLSSVAAEFQKESQLANASVNNARADARLAIAIAEGAIISVGILVILVVLLSRVLPKGLTIFVGWSLGVLVLLCTGFFYVSLNASRDVCAAMNEYLESPENTTWDKILPCNGLSGVKPQLLAGAIEMNHLIAILNECIQSADRDGATLPIVCVPFPELNQTSSYSNSTCVSPSVFQNRYQMALLNLTCASASGSQVYNGLAVVVNFTEVYPRAEMIADCSFVNQIFKSLEDSQCSYLESSLNDFWVTILLLFVFGSPLVLICSWEQLVSIHRPH